MVGGMCQIPTSSGVDLQFKLQHPLADRNRLVDFGPLTNIPCCVQVGTCATKVMGFPGGIHEANRPTRDEYRCVASGFSGPTDHVARAGSSLMIQNKSILRCSRMNDGAHATS